MADTRDHGDVAGISLRDLFAILAMLRLRLSESEAREMARKSYVVADAMLAARKGQS